MQQQIPLPPTLPTNVGSLITVDAVDYDPNKPGAFATIIVRRFHGFRRRRSRDGQYTNMLAYHEFRGGQAKQALEVAFGLVIRARHDSGLYAAGARLRVDPNVFLATLFDERGSSVAELIWQTRNRTKARRARRRREQVALIEKLAAMAGLSVGVKAVQAEEQQAATG